MKISGFSFCRNAIKLYYPVVESIRSALPMVDEFVVAVGESEDDTLAAIQAIGDPKIRIIETQWDPQHFVRGAINAIQTDIALQACTGDWCLYLQADEVLHEEDHPAILETLSRVNDRPEVEGLLFDYLHFWATYKTYQTSRGWYRREVRMVRNGIGAHSWRDAQGFRIHERKPKVVRCGARIFHYGWVRPPHLMKAKNIALDSLYHDDDAMKKRHPEPAVPFDYGPLDHLARFQDTHPAVMAERIRNQDWTLPPPGPAGMAHGHNKRSGRIRDWVERNILRTRIGEYKNYVLIR